MLCFSDEWKYGSCGQKSFFSVFWMLPSDKIPVDGLYQFPEKIRILDIIDK